MSNQGIRLFFINTIHHVHRGFARGKFNYLNCTKILVISSFPCVCLTSIAFDDKKTSCVALVNLDAGRLLEVSMHWDSITQSLLFAGFNDFHEYFDILAKFHGKYELFLKLRKKIDF